MSGLIEEEERLDIIANSCPGVGACGGMYTANTMASAIEAMVPPLRLHFPTFSNIFGRFLTDYIYIYYLLGSYAAP